MKIEIDTKQLLSKVDSHVTRFLMVVVGSIAVAVGTGCAVSVGLRFMATLSGIEGSISGGVFGAGCIVSVGMGMFALVYWGQQYLWDGHER